MKHMYNLLNFLYYFSLVELPVVSESEILQDFSKLYSETFVGDDFHDIVIKVSSFSF